MTLRQKPAERVWEDFCSQEDLTQAQLDQFMRYQELLTTWNNEMNLTAITDLSGIVRQHFQDSLALRKAYDLGQITSLADIGSGAGFPGIPLKILFPQIKVYLLEVTKKKQRFLQEVITTLGLTDIEIIDLDWRTFLRTTQYAIDFFVTRAAFGDEELIRLFKPSCFYNKAMLVYWASAEWEMHKKATPYFLREATYQLAKKERRLIFFSQKNTSESLTEKNKDVATSDNNAA